MAGTGKLLIGKQDYKKADEILKRKQITCAQIRKIQLSGSTVVIDYKYKQGRKEVLSSISVSLMQWFGVCGDS